MIDAAVFANLEYFRGRVSVKGDSPKSRAKIVFDRWNKVIEDCTKSNDHSAYRKLFGNAHNEPTEVLGRIINNFTDDQEIIFHIKKLKSECLSMLKDLENRGPFSDALCYIIIELECIEAKKNV